LNPCSDNSFDEASFQDSNSGPSACVTEVSQDGVLVDLTDPKVGDGQESTLQSVSPAQSRTPFGAVPSCCF